MAMVGWVGAGMEVVDGMHAAQSQGVGRKSGDVGAHPGCKVKTLMTPDHTAFQTMNPSFESNGLRMNHLMLRPEAAMSQRQIVPGSLNCPPVRHSVSGPLGQCPDQAFLRQRGPGFMDMFLPRIRPYPPRWPECRLPPFRGPRFRPPPFTINSIHVREPSGLRPFFVPEFTNQHRPISYFDDAPHSGYMNNDATPGFNAGASQDYACRNSRMCYRDSRYPHDVNMSNVKRASSPRLPVHHERMNDVLVSQEEVSNNSAPCFSKDVLGNVSMTANSRQISDSRSSFSFSHVISDSFHKNVSDASVVNDKSVKFMRGRSHLAKRSSKNEDSEVLYCYPQSVSDEAQIDLSDKVIKDDKFRAKGPHHFACKRRMDDCDLGLHDCTSERESLPPKQVKANILICEAEVDTLVDAEADDDTTLWVRSSPADLYFKYDDKGSSVATQRMVDLEDSFEEQIVNRAERARLSLPVNSPPLCSSTPHIRGHGHCHGHRKSSNSSDDSSSRSSSSDSENDDGMCNEWVEEMNRKRKHPLCLHPELWYNEPGEMNDGPLCRCSVKAKRTGIRHDVYPGEAYVDPCDPSSDNGQGLHHYRITVSPSTNFLTTNPSLIQFDGHEFIFEGFSLFSHVRLCNVPLCRVIRFHIEYSIHLLEETPPQNFTIRSLDLISRFVFSELLELVDLNLKSHGGCSRIHLLPRFSRVLPENGKEVLSVNEVIRFLLNSSRPLVSEPDLQLIEIMDKDEWQRWVHKVCGMIVTYPGRKPSSVRVDQLDRTKLVNGENVPPVLVHFGIRPAQLSYAGDPVYQKAWKQYMKLKHLLNSKPKISREDKLKLRAKEAQLQELQTRSAMKREVTVELSSQGFIRSGLKSDICQHALILPVLISHIRFHSCLSVLEEHLGYIFNDRNLLQLALTHTSFLTNYGTNPSHARNSLTNCGLRQVEYGDRSVYYQNTRKRGINILVDIMSRMGHKEEMVSEVPHNERLEFLGDAVVEFLSSIHLFYMFPLLEEGGLSTYRTAIVQNQHLAVLAKNLHLQDFLLYVHGPDLCHDSDLRHALANCFEALMGALFLDGGLNVVDKIFGQTLFSDDDACASTWNDLPMHPLQEDEPGGDRHWIESSPALKKLKAFEGDIGVRFNHIRLMAKAFTHKNVGYNLLTMGHNQRLEFLGDTVLQLITSEYLYRHFPEHHEGHLSLLRSSLVNGRTQATVCDDLGMTEYVIYSNTSNDSLDMKTKQRADLLEAFLGALYVDSGLEFCRTFCNVCFFPRLKDFIMNQDWNDPKSQLQQCCLALRKMGGGEPDIPVYKVIESLGPSNTRKYVVAVYFRNERLAKGTGHSIQQAEMTAATNALKLRSELFPILQHQRRFLDRRHHTKRYQKSSHRSHHGNRHSS